MPRKPRQFSAARGPQGLRPQCAVRDWPWPGMTRPMGRMIGVDRQGDPAVQRSCMAGRSVVPASAPSAPSDLPLAGSGAAREPRPRRRRGKGPEPLGLRASPASLTSYAVFLLAANSSTSLTV
jgi:hypothetical protein